VSRVPVSGSSKGAWAEIRAWFTDLFNWVWSVAKQWVPLVTGGTVTAILLAVSVASGKSLTTAIGLWIFVGAVLGATFLAWRKERNESREARSGSLRYQALALWREMRDYYEAHKSESEFGPQFIEKYEARINHFKDGMAAVIGTDNIWPLPPRESPFPLDAEKVKMIIYEFAQEASQVAEDIPG
jgi:hypothetical protein